MSNNQAAPPLDVFFSLPPGGAPMQDPFAMGPPSSNNNINNSPAFNPVTQQQFAAATNSRPAPPPIDPSYAAMPHAPSAYANPAPTVFVEDSAQPPPSYRAAPAASLVDDLFGIGQQQQSPSSLSSSSNGATMASGGGGMGAPELSAGNFGSAPYYGAAPGGVEAASSTSFSPDASANNNNNNNALPNDVATLQQELVATRQNRDYFRGQFEAANIGMSELTRRIAELEEEVRMLRNQQQQQQQHQPVPPPTVPTFPCANRRCNCTVLQANTFCAPTCQQGQVCAQPVHQAGVFVPAATAGAAAAAAAATTTPGAPVPMQQQQQQPPPVRHFPRPRMPPPGVHRNMLLDNNTVRVCGHCKISPRIPGIEFCDACSLSIEHAYKQMMPNFQNTIRFYAKTAPFYEFTNFYPCKIEYEGKVYRQSEALFQAAKFMFTAPQIAEQIRLVKTPREAFDLAHKYYQLERQDWMQVRDQWMLLALRLKFKNAHMRRILMLTDPAVLIEHTTNDKYWGNNGDDTGANKLGSLLMQVRHEIATQVL